MKRKKAKLKGANHGPPPRVIVQIISRRGKRYVKGAVRSFSVGPLTVEETFQALRPLLLKLRKRGQTAAAP